ncbi:RNA polymerase sigma-70 factor (ECF subfamily) [Nocardioides sp. BE266]|uniref:RNA polymerase sigma factor n=1 Tax=Nocardioides sp. BE266 TaxID=2817725 RepID=UPI002863F381|nr:sigma-70 family RNA polymerase sigma factor [Nocardioides sp. BE266]MDR7253133.1 RNA polymerase sigma-70 factor (ECF subfamily) [Nocardioides sp. BE266]
MRQVVLDVAPDVATPARRAAATHERERFADFYRAELPGLVSLARGLCGAAAAEDVAQEAMLAAYRRWAEVEDAQSPHAWVRRTCANLAISSFRRRLVELKALARISPRAPVVPLDEESEEFWAAVRSLPRRQAQCAALRYVYGMSGADIAGTLAISEGSVKAHLARARATLAQRLGVEGS